LSPEHAIASDLSSPDRHREGSCPAGDAVRVLQRHVLADLAAHLWALVAERDVQRRQAFRDLHLGERLGDRDVGVAAVVGVPLGQVRVDGADAGDDAVDDVDDRAPDLARAKQLAEVQIITACPVYDTLGNPPSLFSVLRGSGPVQKLTVGGNTVPVVILPDMAEPVIRFHCYDLVADPRMGTGALLGEVRAHIQLPADMSTEPVTVNWTAHRVHEPTGGTHSSWDDAHNDLATLLSSNPAPALP
jgi:hypothetical protein